MKEPFDSKVSNYFYWGSKRKRRCSVMRLGGNSKVSGTEVKQRAEENLLQAWCDVIIQTDKLSKINGSLGLYELLRDLPATELSQLFLEINGMKDSNSQTNYDRSRLENQCCVASQAEIRQAVNTLVIGAVLQQPLEWIAGLLVETGTSDE